MAFFFCAENPMNHEQTLRHLRRANAVAQRAASLGRHPFGALLVAPDGETVLAEQGNIDTVHHAEATLARTASLNYSREYLWDCTLVTTFEPCAMCAATAYWANIGHIVYGASEEALLELTGNSDENPTLNLPCRQVVEAGQKPMTVEGPFDELTAELVEPHRGFWHSSEA